MRKSPAVSTLGSPSPLSPLNPNQKNYVELGEMKRDDGRGYRSGQVGDEPPTPLTPELPPRPPPASSGLTDAVNSWWLFELLAWIISAIAMAVLVVTLILTDGRPLPHWPMRITLNSFISILATIIKAAMVVPIAEGISQLKWLWFKKAGVLKDIQTFDEASRGMWGSLKLLLGTRGVHLAKLGAFLTVFSLALDPFIQQIVTYPIDMVPSDTNSTIPIAHSYSDYAFGGMMGLKNPSLSMKAAISSGLYDTNDDPLADFDVTPYCPTGNCTWTDTYQSLAVCSKCANITESLTSNCEDFGLTEVCNHTLPNNFTLQTGFLPMVYINTTGAADSINFNDTQATLSTLTTIRSLHDASSIKAFGAIAMECVLYACVNEYQAVVKNGTFTETVVATYSNSTQPGTQDNMTITPENTGQPFVIESFAWNAIEQYLGTFWTGNVTGSTGESSPTSDAVDAIYQLGENAHGGENLTMASLAKSMTYLLRTQNKKPRNTVANVPGPDRHVGVAKGVAWTTQTYVHVRWMWFIFPAVLEGLTLVFLLGTILMSQASGVAVWKSSTLALLQIRMVDDERQGGGSTAGRLREWGSGRLGDLNEWANKSEVRLHRSETGTEFHLHRKIALHPVLDGRAAGMVVEELARCLGDDDGAGDDRVREGWEVGGRVGAAGVDDSGDEGETGDGINDSDDDHHDHDTDTVPESDFSVPHPTPPGTSGGKSTARILTIRASTLADLKAAATATLQATGPPGAFVSTQDVLSALFWTRIMQAWAPRLLSSKKQRRPAGRDPDQREAGEVLVNTITYTLWIIIVISPRQSTNSTYY
ncbi:acid phosphatase protein [Diplodia corticola]|uniref:Acid phosphatase protein n=1 Tax=Diplodia corticola TaxID=236234 RepID=A0A1J9QSN8_9PEZI|nr:acid phosphatase protein [Diplodia corticola]OJD31464.1 acid phosphatase protein [Diplodia corticola]